MRRLRILLALAATAITALAQTNQPQPAVPEPSTNYNYLAPTPTPATTNRAANVRVLSLQDCIQLALKHNLDLQIDRYNPEFALFNLRGSYGAYDPTFAFQGEHDHTDQGSQIVANGFQIPGATSDSDIFRTGLNGLTPWGLTYNLEGNINDTYGKSSSLSIVTNGSGTNITFVTNVFAKPFENTLGTAAIVLRQPLLKNFWIDSARLNIKINKNRFKYSEMGLKFQLMQTITTLEQAYFDLIYNRENVVVQQKAVELAERLVMENRKKLEVGTLAPLDLQSAEAQAAQSRATLIAAQNQEGTSERTLKQLITDNYSDWASLSLEPSGNLTAPPALVNVQDSWTKGLTQRPDLIQARLDVEQAGIQLKFDYNQLFPQLDAFGSYGYNGSGLEFSSALYDIQQRNLPAYTVGGSISLPLANTLARNTYKNAKATLEQVILTLKKQEENVMVQIDNDVNTIRANYNQVQATRAAREYEESALDAEQKKLENGKSTTYTVLQVQRDLTNARGSEIQALDNYNKSLSQLSLDEGSTLDRLGIRFEVK